MRLLTLSVFALFTSLLGCKERGSFSTVRVLPMDSSTAVIVGTTGLWADSCLPGCWPRDFKSKKKAEKYTAYIWENTLSEVSDYRHISAVEMMRRIVKGDNIDSVYNPLITHLYELKEIRIISKDISLSNTTRVNSELVSHLKNQLTDDKLGYIHISPVVIDHTGVKGVFFYSLQAEFHTSWLILVEKRDSKWKQVKKILLKIS